MDQHNQDFDKSEYNLAFTYIYKINELANVCDTASIQLDAYLWFRVLYALKRRLSIKMTNDVREDFDFRLEDINADLEEINRKLEANKKDKIPEVSNTVYKKLHKLQEDLLILADKYGLLIKNLDSPEFKFFG